MLTKNIKTIKIYCIRFFSLLLITSFVTLGIFFIVLGIQEGKRYHYQWILKKKSLEKEVTVAFLKASKKIKERWEYGDLEENFVKGRFNCPEEISYQKNIDPLYLRCNPNYIQCFFAGGTGVKDSSVKVKVDDHEYTVIANPIFLPVDIYSNKKRFYTIVTRSNSEGVAIPSYGIMINLSLKEFPAYSVDVIFENSCDNTYLPQRIYRYGPYLHPENRLKLKQDEWKWDNFGRDIYIDKYLVTFRDLIEWSRYGKGSFDAKISLVLPQDRTKWAAPATNISIDNMQRYCSFKGKELLEAHIFDAASFYPLDIENPFTIEITHGPYPWCQEEEESFIYRLKQAKNSVYTPTEKECRTIYTSDCQEVFPYPLYSNDYTTWMGMQQVMGGYLEFLRNPLESNKNLKASSFYFDIMSKWHVLGARAFWDGHGLTSSNFDWEGEDVVTKERQLQVGFRCMKSLAGEFQ